MKDFAKKKNLQQLKRMSIFLAARSLELLAKINEIENPHVDQWAELCEEIVEKSDALVRLVERDIEDGNGE